MKQHNTINNNLKIQNSKNNSSGFFTLEFKDGTKFNSELNNGEINLYGILENINEKIIYKGSFDKYNEKQIGKLIFDDGKIIYEGEFYKGKFDRKGELIYSWV